MDRADAIKRIGNIEVPYPGPYVDTDGQLHASRKVNTVLSYWELGIIADEIIKIESRIGLQVLHYIKENIPGYVTDRSVIDAFLDVEIKKVEMEYCYEGKTKV